MNTDRAAESTDIPPEIDDLYEGEWTTANPNLPDVLQVRMGDRVLGRLRLDDSAASFSLKSFALPSDVLGTIQTLTFEIIPGDRTVRSEVRIDDVTFR